MRHFIVALFIFTSQYVLGVIQIDLSVKMQDLYNRKRDTGANILKGRSLRDLTETIQESDFKNVDSDYTLEGAKVVRYLQTYHGIPVYNSYATIEVDPSNEEMTGQVSGILYEKIQEDIKSTVPKLSEEQSLKATMHSFGLTESHDLQGIQIKLIIVPIDSKAKLAYDVSFTSFENDKIISPKYFIDANSGVVLRKLQQIKDIKVNSVGGNTKIGKYEFGKDFPYLKVLKSKKNKKICKLVSNNVRIFDLKNSTKLKLNQKPFKFKCKDGVIDPVNNGYSPLSDAFFAAEQLFEMYREWCNTRPVAKTPMDIWVHYGNLTSTAKFTGTLLVFGDGTSHKWYPMITFDTIGHEFGHAFTDAHSALEYQDQSGAVNEAYSDLVGEALELFTLGKSDLHAGASIDKQDDEGIRDLCDQTQDGRSIINVNNFKDGMEVHYSSGVINRVTCLLSKSPNLDLKSVFQIYTHANRFYWNEHTDYLHAACGILKASYDLGHDTKLIRDTFSMVGIKEVCDVENYVRRIFGKLIIRNLQAKTSEDIVYAVDGNIIDGNFIRLYTSEGTGDVDMYVGYNMSVTSRRELFTSTSLGNLEIIQVNLELCRKRVCFVKLIPKSESFSGVVFKADVF